MPRLRGDRLARTRAKDPMNPLLSVSHRRQFLTIALSGVAILIALVVAKAIT